MGSPVAWDAWFLGNSAYRRFIPFLGGQTGGGPPGTTVPIHVGKNEDDLLDIDQILALPEMDVSTIFGSYSIAEGPGYLYMCFTIIPNSIKVEGFQVALAGAPEGYTFGVSPITYDKQVIGDDLFFVFRSFYQLNGSFTVVVA